MEIHSAHGCLLNQFLSPLTNKRTDEYGGELSNRIRIHLRVIQAVRSAVGPDFPIQIRLGASDYTEGGTTIEDSGMVARAFERAGVDVIHISGGFVGYTPPGAAGQGYFAPLSDKGNGSKRNPASVTRIFDPTSTFAADRDASALPEDRGSVKKPAGSALSVFESALRV